MRILFVIHSFPPDFLGGHETRCDYVATGLRKLDHQVLVLTAHGASRGSRKDRDSWFLLKTPQSFSQRPSIFQWVAAVNNNKSTLNACIKSFQPEVIVQWNSHRCGAPFLNHLHKISSAPIIAMFGGEGSARFIDYFKEYSQWKSSSKIKQGIKSFIISGLRFLYGSPETQYVYQYAIYPSQFLLDNWQEYGGPKVRTPFVSHLCVDLERFHPNDISAQPTKPRLLFAGRADSNKDPITLLKAAKILKDEGHDFSITMALADSLDNEYDRATMEHAELINDVVTIIRRVPPSEMPALYRKHNILVSISKTEGGAVTLREGMACGLASVTTRCGGSDDLISDGINCLIVPFGNENELAKAINFLIVNPTLRDKIGRNAATLINDRYGMDRHVARAESLIKLAATKK